jgi:lipopolysaccharide export system permease protein
MKRIDRYIFKSVFSSALIALLVLLSLEMFFILLSELEDLGKGSYGLREIITYVVLTSPGLIYETFPMALLLGGLLGMGALASSSELVSMRAAGLSLLQLVGSALRAGLLMGLAALLVGEFVVPQTEFLAQKVRSLAKSEAISVRAGRGFWARDGNYFINVRAVLPGIKLADIYVYEIDESSNLKSVIWAQSAQYVDVDGSWVLQDVQRSLMEPERVITDTLVSMTVNWQINPKLLEVLATNPKDLSMRDLIAYIEYLENNGLDARSYKLAFWIKAEAPFVNLAMLYIAMPFVFGPQRTTGVGQRLIIGIFIGIGFFLFNRMLGNLVLLYDYPPWFGASLPALLFFSVGTYALRRMR